MPKIKKNLRKITVEIDEGETPFTPPQIDYPISKDELVELYYDNLMSLNEIADHIGRGETTVRRWMDYYDLPRRNYSEATILHYKKLRELKEEVASRG